MYRLICCQQWHLLIVRKDQNILLFSLIWSTLAGKSFIQVLYYNRFDSYMTLGFPCYHPKAVSYPTWAIAHPNNSGLWFKHAPTNSPPLDPPLIVILKLWNINVIFSPFIQCSLSNPLDTFYNTKCMKERVQWVFNHV